MDKNSNDSNDSCAYDPIEEIVKLEELRQQVFAQATQDLCNHRSWEAEKAGAMAAQAYASLTRELRIAKRMAAKEAPSREGICRGCGRMLPDYPI